MGEIQTISYVGVSHVQIYPDMDNDQYNIRRFKNYCINNEFLCHFEDGNITPDGLRRLKTPNYNITSLITTTPITPNTVYTFISYHNNNDDPIRELCVYCNNGANIVAKFPAGNNGISLVTGITPGTITDQTKFNLYNSPNGSSGTIEIGWIMVLPYVANDWPLPALWCKTGPNILNTGMGTNKGHILVSNTYTEGLAPSNNITMGEPCFYYLDDTMLPTNLQGNEPMILYNNRRSATLPDATSNEDAILKIQQNQNLLIYDADMSDYVYYNMENTTLLFDFGNLNTYDGSDIPPRIYNLKNTLWDYYLTINPSITNQYYTNTEPVNNGSPNNKGLFFRENSNLFVNNTVNSKLIIPNNGHFMCGLRIKVYPDLIANEIYGLVVLPISIRLDYTYEIGTTRHRFTLSSYHNGSYYIPVCTTYFTSSNPERVTVVFGRLSNGKYFLNVVNKGSNISTSLPLVSSNGTFKLAETAYIGSGNGGCELNLIQMWLDYGVDESNAYTFSNNFHNTVSTRWT